MSHQKKSMNYVRDHRDHDLRYVIDAIKSENETENPQLPLAD